MNDFSILAAESLADIEALVHELKIANTNAKVKDRYTCFILISSQINLQIRIISTQFNFVISNIFK